MYVGVSLAFIVLHDIVLEIILYGRSVVVQLEEFVNQHSLTDMTSVNTLVYFFEHIIDFRRSQIF